MSTSFPASGRHIQIKVCGITRPEDAAQACALGVDALGLVFWSGSKRCVDVEQARDICAAIAPFTSIVALMVNATDALVDRVLEQLPVTMLQWHGDESPEFCERWQAPYVRALPVLPGRDLLADMAQYPRARGFLLDAVHDGQFGGTGQAFDWQALPEAISRPIILAGGLSAENVAQGISTVRPTAVDVSSGVESVPGIKDPIKIERFVTAVRAAQKDVDP